MKMKLLFSRDLKLTFLKMETVEVSEAAICSQRSPGFLRQLFPICSPASSSIFTEERSSSASDDH